MAKVIHIEKLDKLNIIFMLTWLYLNEKKLLSFKNAFRSTIGDIINSTPRDIICG